MWTDVGMTQPGTTYTQKALLSQRGFDTNWTSAVYTSWVTLILTLILAVPNLWVFANSYLIANDIKTSHWEHVYDDAGFDENGYDAQGYNAAGCDEAGNDVDGYSCEGTSNEVTVGY